MFPPENLDLRYDLSDSGAALNMGDMSIAMAVMLPASVQQPMETATYVVQ